MATMLEYVRTNTDSFEERPLCRVDALVFSWLASLRIPEELPAACTEEGVTIAEMGARENVLGLVAPVHDPKQSELLLRACAESPRFGVITGCRAADEWSRTTEKQFSAITFLLPQGAFIAFRGTDNTLVGWKENFNMAFRDVVPAQEEAVTYVKRIGYALRCSLWLGGHSKGGNLALFATANCDPLTRLRIERCYAFDAPGLSQRALSTSYWDDAVPLIERIMPEESIVGLLLWETNDVQPTIVRSSNGWLMQHAALSWQVEGQDFATVRAVSYDTYLTGKRLSAWLATLGNADRERFVEILYKLAQATGEVTFGGLIQSVQTDSLDLVLRKLDGLPEADRAFFAEACDDLVATLLLGPAPTTPQTPKEHVAAASDKIDDLTARFDSTLSRIEKYAGL